MAGKKNRPQRLHGRELNNPLKQGLRGYTGVKPQQIGHKQRNRYPDYIQVEDWNPFGQPPICLRLYTRLSKLQKSLTLRYVENEGVYFPWGFA